MCTGVLHARHAAQELQAMCTLKNTPFLQASQHDPIKAAATAEALSALLVLLAPPGSSPHNAPPPPGDLLTEFCLAGTAVSFTAAFFM